ncbi:hypothetical protein [Alkalicoccus halolimnae]|uniref:Uncharacterized protein n=1 Tax=Alkalicoccus halolimnae TaxID=1667239 RepID=A0AAJ8LX51_9BACI|nr:hypothetical protein [Alkalicoccus halolimnae]
MPITIQTFLYIQELPFSIIFHCIAVSRFSRAQGAECGYLPVIHCCGDAVTDENPIHKK